VSSETIRLSISLRLAVDILHVMYVIDKQMLVLDFIFDLFYNKCGGSSVSFFFFFYFYGSVSYKRLRSKALEYIVSVCPFVAKTLKCSLYSHMNVCMFK
jgi:hypothetical protein